MICWKKKMEIMNVVINNISINNSTVNLNETNTGSIDDSYDLDI